MNTQTELDTFTRAYIACALWSSTDDSGEPLDASFSASDLAPESLSEMIRECTDFQEANRALLEQASEAHPDYGDESAGHDFWLTRNRHGAGFWDRGLGDIGRALTDAAHAYGPSDIYEGNNGQLYVC